jgi:hypothetical protein
LAGEKTLVVVSCNTGDEVGVSSDSSFDFSVKDTTDLNLEVEGLSCLLNSHSVGSFFKLDNQFVVVCNCLGFNLWCREVDLLLVHLTSSLDSSEVIVVTL